MLYIYYSKNSYIKNQSSSCATALIMAPIKAGPIYTTPAHKRPPKTHFSTLKSSSRARSQDKLSNENRMNKDTVGVYLRLRPIKLDEPTLVKIDDQQVKTLPPDGSSPQIYTFTQVFDDAPQSEIFDKVARPVVEDFLVSSKDGLIFTYGITGSGKTYTMEGLKSDPGLIYRTVDFLFNSIGAQQTRKNLLESDGQNFYKIQIEDQLYPNLARSETPSVVPSVIKWRNRTKESAYVSVDPSVYYCLYMSLIELYNKQVHDLFEDFDPNPLEKKRREIRSDIRGLSYVANAVEIEVKSADEAVDYYTRGVKRRKTGSTALNQESSRGHCVLNLKLVKVRKSYDGQFDKDSIVASQLCLVDLAGSERAKRSGATGGALHEACNINNSLGALRKCIRALRDREPPSNIQYREYSLTRLFKSYFEGYGSVRMVLCVKPTAEDFQENNIAMDFGLLTQDVAVDYASPPKLIKRSRSRNQDTNYAMMYEYFDKKMSHFEPDPNLSDEKLLETWIERLYTNREKRKKYFETAMGAENEVRQNILATMEKNQTLRQQLDLRARDLRNREEQLELLESKLHSTERSREGMNDKIKTLEKRVKDLDAKNKRAKEVAYQFEARQSQNEKLCRDVVSLIKSEHDRSETLKRVMNLFRKMCSNDYVGNAATPSAPEIEPLQCSSPMDVPNPSTCGTTEPTNTPPTTSNTSSEGIAYQARGASPCNRMLSSPTSGVPVVNPRYNRSLSCSSMQWIHHNPSGTIDTGTVLKPKFKNGKSVRKLRSSDILRKDAAGYSVVHQDADSNGDVETSVYKGQIISTVCGGAQVILNDIETMKQVSPEKRKRAASDAHYTH